MNIDKLDLQSPDLVNENFDKLAALFPNCVTESANGKAIDFDLLKQELSYAVIEGNRERYRLEWPGKREAIVTANLPTTKTLRPVREDSVDFDNTENLYIEGDNLEVLKILQESYFGKIKMIYIDPPYNTGNDFVYKDNFDKDKESELFESGQVDEYNQRLVANPETAGRYHSDWLSMMYPRLKLARNLLTDDGVIFISIDDNEVHNLRKVCDEVFGEGNFVGDFIWRKKNGGGQAKEYFVIEHEYILVYRKTESFMWIDSVESRDLDEFKKSDDRGRYKITKLAKWGNTARREDRPSMYFSLVAPDGREVFPIAPDGNEGRWRVGHDRMNYLKENNLIHWESKNDEWVAYEKEYFDNQIKTVKDRSILYTLANTGDGTNILTNLFAIKDTFENPKPIEMLSLFFSRVTEDNDIILDFFSGSATTGHAVMQLNAEDDGNRKYIMVQLPEQTDEKSEAYKAGYKNICEIGKERIRRAANKIKEEKRIKAEMDGMFADYKDTQDYGFRVYRLDSSNMQDVYYRPQDYKQEVLDMFADNIKSDRTPDDLLAQVMLDWGLPLSYKIEQVNVNDKQVFKVAEDRLFACFDKGIDEAFAKEIAKEKPLRIVFRDNGFANDTAKINVQQLLKQLSPQTEMKVI